MRPHVLARLGRRRRRLGGRTLVRATMAAQVAIVLVANGAGAAVVFALLALVLPGIEADDPDSALLWNGVAAAAYLAVAIALGLTVGVAKQRPGFRWMTADRAPTAWEQRRALRAPLVLFGLHAALWAAAAVLFGAVNALGSVELGVRVAIATALGGITTSAVAYLLSERVWRPVAVRALAIGPPTRPQAPGVALRFLLAWALGTAVPVLGLVLLGAAALAYDEASGDELALTMVVLGGVAIVVGLLAVLVTARAVAGPVRSVRRALRRVEEGDLAVEVPVDDGSELGLLQAGVNRMTSGLRERERLRDLFGRHVGEDVARAAMDRGVALGGEVRDVAVLFVDVVGSTRLAAERAPEEVVELLNRFFAVVVEVVGEHGGWVNKFEGDAALAVFGAPHPLRDRDARALAAARTLAARLAREVPQLAAGIGVSSGPAVAGNVGARERFEYTVIGDPVNEAARLTELAKDVPGRVVVVARMLDGVPEDERGRWQEGERVRLRGRHEDTVVATPTGAGGR